MFGRQSEEFRGDFSAIGHCSSRQRSTVSDLFCCVWHSSSFDQSHEQWNVSEKRRVDQVEQIAFVLFSFSPSARIASVEHCTVKRISIFPVYVDWSSARIRTPATPQRPMDISVWFLSRKSNEAKRKNCTSYVGKWAMFIKRSPKQRRPSPKTTTRCVLSAVHIEFKENFGRVNTKLVCTYFLSPSLPFSSVTSCFRSVLGRASTCTLWRVTNVSFVRHVSIKLSMRQRDVRSTVSNRMKIQLRTNDRQTAFFRFLILCRCFQFERFVITVFAEVSSEQ